MESLTLTTTPLNTLLWWMSLILSVSLKHFGTEISVLPWWLCGRLNSKLVDGREGRISFVEARKIFTQIKRKGVGFFNNLSLLFYYTNFKRKVIHTSQGQPVVKEVLKLPSRTWRRWWMKGWTWAGNVHWQPRKPNVQGCIQSNVASFATCIQLWGTQPRWNFFPVGMSSGLGHQDD